MADDDRGMDDAIAPASLGADTSEGERQKLCANCGATLDTGDWTPTVASFEEDADGDSDVVVFLFCAEDCRESWRKD